MKTCIKAKALREAIIRSNLEDKEFAGKIGVSPPHLSRLLRGERNPSGEVRQALMEVTKLPFDTLFEIVELQEEDKQAELAA